MARFVGKWIGDSSTYNNYDAFAKESGMTEELIENLRHAVNEIEYSRDGEKWICKMHSTAAPEHGKTYNFKSGVEETTVDPWGGGLKYLIIFESDMKMTEVEKAEMTGWKPVYITREIIGPNKLRETCKLESGTTMTCEMNRVQT